VNVDRGDATVDARRQARLVGADGDAIAVEAVVRAEVDLGPTEDLDRTDYVIPAARHAGVFLAAFHAEAVPAEVALGEEAGARLTVGLRTGLRGRAEVEVEREARTGIVVATRTRRLGLRARAGTRRLGRLRRDRAIGEGDEGLGNPAADTAEIAGAIDHAPALIIAIGVDGSATGQGGQHLGRSGSTLTNIGIAGDDGRSRECGGDTANQRQGNCSGNFCGLHRSLLP